MNQQVDETLGVARVDIRSALLKSLRRGWAYLRVPVKTRGRSNSLEVVDNRPKVVETAEKVLEISVEINLVKRHKSTAKIAVLRKNLSAALKEFQAAFQSPAIVSVQEQVTVGGGESYQRIILNDAGEDEPDAILDVVRTTGIWRRDPRSNFRPVYGDRERRNALHVVYANEEGVSIWDLRESKVHLFQFSFPEGRKMRTFLEEVHKAEPEEEVIGVMESPAVEVPEESEDEPAPAKKTRRKKDKGNSRIETECPECGSTVTVKAKDLAAGTATCPECEVELTSED